MVKTNGTNETTDGRTGAVMTYASFDVTFQGQEYNARWHKGEGEGYFNVYRMVAYTHPSLGERTDDVRMTFQSVPGKCDGPGALAAVVKAITIEAQEKAAKEDDRATYEETAVRA